MLRRITRLLLGLFTAYLLAVGVLTFAYWFIPPATPLMLQSFIRGDGMDRRFVTLSRISPALQRAVLVSEDARFCQHAGIDWYSVDKAISQADQRRRGPRGASTITMQVVKNLFLWNGRSWIRKAVEAPLALWLDIAMPKHRIFEIYLNIAEWGKGRFGIEAAARHEFGISAAQLSPHQAAMLVTMLPDPTRRSARNPGPTHQLLASYLQRRMAREGANTRCLR
jgi:monofunctional biosynthetic peptidoglycan transglycosylase